MRYYNVAIIVTGIDEEYQHAVLSGIQQFAAENHVNLSIFTAFGGVLENQNHDRGEFNIFSLPDYSKFDGFILLTNTIANSSVTNFIIDKIKSSDIPAVSIDYDIPGFMHVGIDNEFAMRLIAQHFVSFHGFNRFFYISGPKDNPESSARLEAFLKVMADNNISFSDDDIFYGDFRDQSGRDAVKYLLSSQKILPQAVICANDVMAISAISSFEAAGYNVPHDIAFSGFDNTYEARNYSPELTSVQRPLKKSGAIACQKLIDAVNKISQERSVILDMQPRFTESCGCDDSMSDDISSFKKKNYYDIESNNISLSLINRMSCQLIEYDDFDEYLEGLKKFILEIKAEEFYLCLCSDWNNAISDSLTSPHEEVRFTVDGYTDKIIVPLAYADGVFFKADDFSSSLMLPSLFVSAENPKTYYFVPIHFRERCLGYCVVLNSTFPMQSSMFQTFIITISNTIENIRKIINLDSAVKKLDKLYTVDTLSGISNRNGFKKDSERLFNFCMKRSKNVMLMFIDMDGLKMINDTYGHKEGDQAICALANVLTDSCLNGEVYCRFGGDEFIIFAPEYDTSEAELLSECIQDNIDKFNSTSKHNFTLSASIGYHISVPKAETNLFQLVTYADKVMYENKKRKKSSQYLKKELK